MVCASCAVETDEAPCSACGADPSLDGRYRLEHPLGHGGTGITWSAVRTSDGLRVAIKAVPIPPRPSAKERQLLGREVEVLRQLDHPAIPSLLDAFEVRAPGGVRIQHVVMGFIEGQTLGAEIAQRRLTETEVLQILDELAGILGYLHDLSPPVVHRDLKPDNVIRRRDGGLSLIDFGAVKDVLSDPLVGGSTFVGSFGYMAPEQLHGDACPRSDLYALGALAVRLLTRIEPRDLVEHQRLAWRARCQVSDATAALIDALLEPEPEGRPPSAEAVQRWIARIHKGPRPATPRPTPRRLSTPSRPASPSLKRSLAILGTTGAGVLLGLVALFGLALWWIDPFGPPIHTLDLQGIQLGLTLPKLRQRFHGELQPGYDDDRLKAQLLIGDLPAHCTLWLPEETGGTLCEIHCDIRGADRRSAQRLRSSLSYLQGGPWSNPTGWKWSDRETSMRIFAESTFSMITHRCTEIEAQRRVQEQAEQAESERQQIAEEVQRLRGLLLP